MAFRNGSRVTRCGFLLLWTFLFLQGIYSAEPSAVAQHDTPEAVAASAMQALREDRISDFAGMMHPKALKKFKDLMTEVLAVAAEMGEEKQVVALFKGVGSSDELKKLDEKQFFAVFLQGVYMLRPDFKQMMTATETEALGHVMEGQDMAHVVGRMKVPVQGTTVTQMHVISVQRTETGWAMMLRQDIESMAVLLRSRLGKKK